MPSNPDHYSQIVEQYHRYRPRYPTALIEWLRATCGLTPAHTVADIGAGTGQLSSLLLEHGSRVVAVEPNAEMRQMAVRHLGGHAGFVAVDGTAEATALADQSVDLIVVGNAFHWFDHGQARREFARILTPGGWVVLLWNLERKTGSPFGEAFERFWQTHIDPGASFARFSDRPRPSYLATFFGAAPLKEHCLDNEQVCDLQALTGLARSFLKSPQPGDPRYPAMLADLEALFNRHQTDGTVTLAYDTAIFYGQLTTG
jgi:ubiquinone/menaquinone biosynthesis C-methylase UbiE